MLKSVINFNIVLKIEASIGAVSGIGTFVVGKPIKRILKRQSEAKQTKKP